MKKNAKNGYPFTGYISFCQANDAKYKLPYTIGATTREVLASHLEEEKAEYPTANLTVYEKPEDFIMVA